MVGVSSYCMAASGSTSRGSEISYLPSLILVRIWRMKATDYPTFMVFVEGLLSSFHSFEMKLFFTLSSSCSVKSMFHLRISSEKASNAFCNVSSLFS